MDPRQTTLSGEITDVFAHRFVIRTDAGKALADLGPKGAETSTLKVGERVDVTGEMKPSELKVSRLVRAGQEPIAIDHDKPKPGAGHKPKPGGGHEPKPGGGHEPHEKSA